MRWQKEKDPLIPGRTVGQTGWLSPFTLFGTLALVLTVASFFLWDGSGNGGEISRAVSYFEEFFGENEAVAVFLGWEGA